MQRFVGLDVGGTNVRTAEWDGSSAQPVAAAAGRLPADYQSFLALVSALTGNGATRLGIGLPGRVSVSGAVVKWMPNIPYLDGKSLAADLEANLGAPVILANDAQLALLGEARFGAAANEESAALISVGTGIGGAMMFGRKIVRGARGTTGAFGWLPVRCAPGTSAQSGPWELTCSGRALDARARRLYPPLAATELLQAAESGREDARALLDEYSRQFATGLAGLASAFDPAVILVSGGVSSLIGELLPGITRLFREAASPSVRETPIAIARHGHLAGAFGACAFAKELEGAFLQ